MINIKMPSNCVFCYERGIGKVINCQLIQSGCANCGRHPNCPLVDIEDIKAEIEAMYGVTDFCDGSIRIDKYEVLASIEQKIAEVKHEN